MCFFQFDIAFYSVIFFLIIRFFTHVKFIFSFLLRLDGQFIIPRPVPPPPESVDSSDELANGNNNSNKQNSVFGIHNINSTLIRKRPYDSNQTNGTEGKYFPKLRRMVLVTVDLLCSESKVAFFILSLSLT